MTYNHRTLTIFGIVMLLTLRSAAPAQSEQTYVWPVKDRIEVTGVFCDVRNGHPHGGIDLSHFGKVGVVPILSVGDGVLMRIRSSDYGYGNAVYILMPGGKVAVYAHLDRFSEKLQQVATDIRRRTGLARLNYYYEPHEMNVKISKGEIIGYGGKSGTSTAHLHFEIRQDDLVNLNPLTNGFAIQDTVAPRILSLMFTPVDADARVDGARKASIYSRAGMTKKGPIRLKGRVGLSADVKDQNRKGGRRYHPYAMRILVDGKPYFETRYEKWGYIDQNIWITQYDATPKGDKFMRAYNPYPVEIPFFSGADKGTFGDLSPGVHAVEFVAADANGLEDRLAFSIEIKAGEDPAKRPWPRGDGAYEIFNNKTVEAGRGDFAVVGRPYSLFEPALVDVTRDKSAQNICWRISDPGVPLRRNIGVRFRYGQSESNPEKLGVFFMDGTELKYIGARHDSDNRYVSADADAFGNFCLMRDDAPPLIGKARVSKGSRPTVIFSVQDDLSGFAPDSAHVYIDGRLTPVDFNPRTGGAKAKCYWKLDPGKHEVRIEVKDRQGNTATKVLSHVAY